MKIVHISSRQNSLTETRNIVTLELNSQSDALYIKDHQLKRTPNQIYQGQSADKNKPIRCMGDNQLMRITNQRHWGQLADEIPLHMILPFISMQ
jgi:hypothetical protein